MKRPTIQKQSPPVAATTEGHTEALEATGKPSYSEAGKASKLGFSGRHKRPERVSSPIGRSNALSVTYRASNGLEWRYRGKRARVITMLAETDSVTQWDTLPWHTRLGGTIHALRCDGLAIDTELVGEYRHARYRLRTPGTVIIHRSISEAGQ